MERFYCPTVRAPDWKAAEPKINDTLQRLVRMLNEISTGAGIPNARMMDDSLMPVKMHELRNTYVHSDQDSLDPTYPFELDFEIVSEMTEIRHVKLSFRIRNFRAYATGGASGGASTTGVKETPSGGGATSGAQGTPSGGGSTSGAQGTPSGGGSTSGSATHNHPGSTAGGGGHDHYIPGSSANTGNCEPWPEYCNLGAVHHHGYFFRSSSTATEGDHTHSLNITSDGAHRHSTPNHTHPNHTHTTPNHTHPNHTHTTPDHTHPTHNHTTPNHSHNLTFGIYEDAQSPTLTVKIDNGDGYGDSIGSYGADQLDIDITEHISDVGFKRIKFETDVRTRISAWIMCKVDIQA